MNLTYIRLLMKKEILQIRRDKSILAITVILPLLLVVIYGSCLRMDVKPVYIAYVNNQESAVSLEIGAALKGSNYLRVSEVADLQLAEYMMRVHEIKAFVYLQNNFAAELSQGRGEINIVVNGTEAQASSVSEGYIVAAVNSVLADYYPQSAGMITVNSRSWFNEANESTWFLMSGQYVGIVTVMCVFLSCFVISREWDRGTVESLSASSVSALEIVIAKLAVYFVLGLSGMLITVGFGQLCYQIPLRGSLLWLGASMTLYTLEMVCLGTLISAVTRSQFLSVQYSIVVGFLPAVLLSGLIFDLRGVEDFIRVISSCLPPTYAVQSNRIIFLSGGSSEILLRNILIHVCFIILLFALTVSRVRRDIK